MRKEELSGVRLNIVRKNSFAPEDSPPPLSRSESGGFLVVSLMFRICDGKKTQPENHWNGSKIVVEQMNDCFWRIVDLAPAQRLD
jgi:hypothetical protein